MAELLSLEEALKRILERVTPLEPEAVPLAAAAGRVLAEDARAAVDLPPFPSSAMDGFAVRSEDTPGRLPVVARIAAGLPAPRATTGRRPGVSSERSEEHTSELQSLTKLVCRPLLVK